MFSTDDKVAKADEATEVEQEFTSSLKESLDKSAAAMSTDNDTSSLHGRHLWSSCNAIRKRECGVSNYRSSDLFRYKAIGSLHMVQRFKIMIKLENDHGNSINCLHFNTSGTRLASGSDHLNICLWDWALQKQVLTFASGHSMNDIYQVRFLLSINFVAECKSFEAKFMPLSGDRHIVTCATDGDVRLAELTEQGVCGSTRKLAHHNDAALKVDYIKYENSLNKDICHNLLYQLALELDSPHLFLSCGADGVVYEIDLRKPQPNK